MQIMIEIPDVDYYDMINDGCIYNYEIRKAIENGIPLPKGHGRLIDADKLGFTDFEILMCNGDYKEALKMLLEKIDNAPTIIEAEMDTDDY